MTTPLKIPVIIEKILENAEDIKTFVMLPQKRCPAFKPGQFLHLAIDPYDPSFNWPESRIFSIGNSPTRKDRITIVFSVKGSFTRRMFNEVKEGDELYIKLPYGDFIFSKDNNPVILIAGGTGITPFFSYLEYVIDNALQNKIYLYYGLRSIRFVLGKSLIEECSKKLSKFKCIFYTEDGSAFHGYNHFMGLLDIDEIFHETKHLENAIYYLSGPPQMIKTFKDSLISMNVSKEFVRIDAWE